VETISRLKALAGVKGVHIMAIEWEEAVGEIVERAGLLSRPGLETAQGTQTCQQNMRSIQSLPLTALNRLPDRESLHGKKAV
jgi:hypothetical protein